MVAVANSSTATLADLLRRADVALPTIAAHLDALTPDERVRQIEQLAGRAVQERLWTLAADGPPLTMEDVLPAGKEQARWIGRNSMPMFTTVDKRVVRQGGDIIGYNHITGVNLWFAGPGYFTMVRAADKPKELVVDYTRLPTSGPAGWPKIEPNTKGTHTFVYGHLTDYCRKISDGVFIGVGVRRGKNLRIYFTVART
ncbi:MAG TPA: hypothetical protein VF334_22765 [Polyangia bacterium]